MVVRNTRSTHRWLRLRRVLAYAAVSSLAKTLPARRGVHDVSLLMLSTSLKLRNSAIRNHICLSLVPQIKRTEAAWHG
jgi:hypothetical protein